MPNSRTSSTKSRCVRKSSEEILIPFNLPVLLASAIKRLRPSITRMNNRGDKGQPCLILREARKKEEGEPLTSMEKFVEEMHPMIQLTPTRGTPIWMKIRRTKVQFTLSNAFDRSNLRIRADLLCILTECRTSSAIAMGSKICRLFRKPNY